MGSGERPRTAALRGTTVDASRHGELEILALVDGHFAPRHPKTCQGAANDARRHVEKMSGQPGERDASHDPVTIKQGRQSNFRMQLRPQVTTDDRK